MHTKMAEQISVCTQGGHNSFELCDAGRGNHCYEQEALMHHFGTKNVTIPFLKEKRPP